MPNSADPMATPAADGDALTRGAVAYAEGRLAEAEALLAATRRPDERRPKAWELDAALALAAGDAPRAVASLERARDLARAQSGLEGTHILLNLALACIAADRPDAALAARAAAQEALVVRQHLGEAAVRADRDQLPGIDARLARLLWEHGRHDASIAALVRVLAVRGDATSRQRLAGMLGWRGRTAEALAPTLARVLAEPDSAAAAHDMAGALDALHAPEAARAWWRRAQLLGDPAAEAALAAPPSDGPAAAAMGRDSLIARLLRPLQGLASAPQDPVWPVAIARVLQSARGAAPAGAVEADWDALLRDAAIAAQRRALALRPGQPDSAAELARLLQEQPDSAESLSMLRAALKLSPSDAALHTRLAQRLRHEGDAEAAAQSYRVALALQPDMPQAMIGLADALLAQGPSEEALALIDRAEALDPMMPLAQTYALKAIALMGLQRPEAAIELWQRQLAILPDDPGAGFGIGLAQLLMGNFKEGWEGYARRWLCHEIADPGRRPAEPLRRPDPADWPGRTVLLYAEQAQGDTIQFLRYARIVAATGARVLLEVPGSLRTLASSIPDIAGVYARGDDLPAHDFAVPLMSLPWAFGTTLDTVPATVPYLRGDLARAAQFRRRLAGLPGLKVGLVWAGEPRLHSRTQSSMDRRRSVALADLAPLAQVPGIVWVSLQKGTPAAQAADPPAGMVLHDWTAELDDFAATAALMTALDLVISVDTAPAHLAGAVGRPVWLLNRFDTDFRWLRGRDDSPWYPTLRQFRQDRPGDWTGAIARLAAALRERAR